jgi:hypothetical protein
LPDLRDRSWQDNHVGLVARTAPMRAGLVLPMNQYAIDTSIIERLTDVKGALDEKEGVFKVSVPREELSVLLRLARDLLFTRHA